MNTALTPRSQFEATLKLTSDWHVGLGAGRPGEIDRLIQRDTAGLPFIPAKTLTGMWRDACETVALGLDNGETGVWSAWVIYLFGEQPAIATPTQVRAQQHPPRAAALSIRDASFSDGFKQAIVGNQPLLAAMTFIKPGIGIDGKTGCAKENFLRFEEMARAGATLQASCELSLADLSEEQQKAAYCLLAVSTRLMTRLGGKRRRGAGSCELTIEDHIKPWLDWLKENPNPSPPPSVVDSEEVNPQWKKDQNSDQLSEQSQAWQTVPLQITTHSPLVIACRTLGNVVETLDYIPGSHLQRPIMQRLRPQLKGSDIDLGQAIAHKELLVTNATLEIQNQRGLPIPLALSGTKLGGGLKEGGTVYNLLAETAPQQIQLKKEQAGYLIPGELEHLPPFSTVGKAVLTHNTVDDAVQRPTQSVGGVYSYQAIVPKTTFRAELRLPDYLVTQLAKVQADWWKTLTGEARLGQSKKDSYGQVTLTAAAPETASSATEIAGTENQRLTVWLLSDLLLRDERLRPSTSVEVFAKVLGDRLGCKLTYQQPWKAESTESPSKISLVARSHRLESWQVRWGLPRPSLAGFAAGSCFVFTLEAGEQLDPAKLTALAIQGVGNRCAEGFGQVSFNSPLLTQPTSKRSAAEISSDASSVSPPVLLSPPVGSATPEIDYARCIEKAAWREVIQKAAEALFVESAGREQHLGFSSAKPDMSQLGSLRSVLARLKNPRQQTFTAWLNRVSEKRADKWPPGSLAKLKPLFDEDNKVWQLLDEGIQSAALPEFTQLRLVNNDETWLRTELWVEAVQTVMATGIRAHKRSLENNSADDDNNRANVGGTSHGTAA